MEKLKLGNKFLKLGEEYLTRAEVFRISAEETNCFHKHRIRKHYNWILYCAETYFNTAKDITK